MTLIDKLYDALEKEYKERQEERRKEHKAKTLGITTINAPCEEKAILSTLGLPQPTDLESVGALLHGTLLHEEVEKILNKHYKGEFEMEKEYAVKLHGWRIAGHPDIVYRDKRGNAEVYDFKFVHPLQVAKLLRSGEPSLSYKAQVVLYQYLLRKNRINAKTGYLEFFSKAKSSVKLGKRDNEKIDLSEFSIHEAETPYDERLVKVYLNHAIDIIEKVEKVQKQIDEILKQHPDATEKEKQQIIMEKIKNGEINTGLDVKETTEKLMKYFEVVGLDPEEVEKENYPDWQCRYCGYKEICPILEAERRLERQWQNDTKKKHNEKYINKQKEVSI